MKVAAVVSTKGGPGKTTVGANLGAFCADAGVRTLLIDLDNQPSLSSFYNLSHEAPGGTYQLITSNETRPDQIISQTYIPNLSLIKSNDPFNLLSNLLLHAADGRLRLKNLMPAFAQDFDLILIDTQGARSIVLEMALLGSQMAVSPITPDMLTAREFQRGMLQLYRDLEIRRLAPDDTITIMGHSQGTLISLLAQALLVDDNQRCADTVIMVDSPYSVLPSVTPKGSDTLSTLIRIVTATTQAPHAQPPLAALRHPQTYGGRSGPRWSPEQGTRLDKNQRLTVFPERDNRGKVYLYFCPDDTTVALKEVQGIGHFGVPDVLPNGTPAMRALHPLGFYQRLWTRRHRDGEPVLVGKTVQPEMIRAGGESYYPAGLSIPALITQKGIREGQERYINGEPLHPPHAPQMFGGEAITGSPSKPGKDRLDDVGKSVALGKEETPFHWIQMPAEYDPPMITQREALERFNAQSKDAEDHTRAVRKSARHSHHEREETPREARARLEVDSSTWKNNSYHSAVLRSPENHRWVTAMDIAIGQAKCLDDPVMRAVLVAIADWKLDKRRFGQVCELPGWSRLSLEARALVEASHSYYQFGTFPSEDLVSLTPPSLVSGIQKKEPSDE